MCVIAGSEGDRATCAAVRSALGPQTATRVIDFVGTTTVRELAALLAMAAACVGNDSGASHLAAAVGVPLVTIFGPTDERTSAPHADTPGRAEVLTHDVWCRPCMLRECPIDHGCMTGVTPDRVEEAVVRVMDARGGVGRAGGASGGEPDAGALGGSPTP